jgi:membrane-associated phospholipid phosphatase
MVGTIRSLVQERDLRILDWLHKHRGKNVTRFMRVATRLGSVEVLAPLSVLATLALARRGETRAASFVASTATVATATNLLLKALFGRARPDVRLHLSPTSGFAFPSGHAMASAAIYGALAVVNHQTWQLRWLVRIASTAAVAVVGTSRVYLHVHYPSDVVAGWALGAAVPLAFKRLIGAMP